MRIRATAAALFCVLSVVAATGCSAGSSAGAAGASGATTVSSAGAGSSSAVASLIQATCSRCHPIERVKAADHDAAGWTVTITRMRQAHGAPIDDAQAKQIVDFLAGGGSSQL